MTDHKNIIDMLDEYKSCLEVLDCKDDMDARLIHCQGKELVDVRLAKLYIALLKLRKDMREVEQIARLASLTKMRK